ncbi:cytochrome c oxidase subunit II [Corallococcus sp. H22C18031201]|uniref:cytochrome c oxidase subunit II n=1 Tax=Citreicoccus inhibens TaxID=2849499 RepID=UPI000E737833|nr:cytochrome c oxidase subunit II [Citreicoccus inhibens]MBU8897291.1 cytochrome c oxidase subunit II [Citreicoccus inhibens]RJS21149.1 cytochrome c oxidase subunit II [Corallococcus sp. H22C18031201]
MNELLRRLFFLPEQGSTFATRVDALHFAMLLTTLGVGTGLGLTGLVFLVRYRRRASAEPTPHLIAPVWLEAVFVSVPLALFLLWFALGFRQYVWVESPPPDAMDVYVTAKQWMWKFAYPGGPSAIDTLVVPAGRPVRLLITSRDVIHSFFVPDFRFKRDAVPGRYTEIWFEAPRPGRHQVLCAEYCGLDHSQMRGEVVVLSPADFEAWRASRREGVPVAGESMAERGEHVAASQGCLQCHSVTGVPHIGPTWWGLYGRVEPLVGGGKVLADEAYLTESMMDPLAKVVAGYPPVMPSYHGRLSAGDAGALVEFIKSLRPPRPGPPVAEEPVYVPTGR